MRYFKAVAALALAAGLGACVLPYHQENAALRMVRPAAQEKALVDYAAPKTDYPTIGGDILKNQNADFSAAPETPVH